jgi:hypothetical protein
MQIKRFLINDDNLIYYENSSDFRQRLYISKILEKEIFRITHDKNNHIDFYRAYNRIRISLYLHKLIKCLRTYIEYCSKYRIHQIFRYKFYKALKSIISPFIFFIYYLRRFRAKIARYDRRYEYSAHAY